MKSKLFFLIVCDFIFAITTLQAQSFIIYSDKTFGGDKDDQGFRILKSSDSEFILCGHSSTNVNGDKTDPLCDTSVINGRNVWLLKIDTSFNIIWNKDMGGNRGATFGNMITTGSNKQMIFSTASGSDSSCEKSENNRDTTHFTTDYWIYMSDSVGNKIWDKTLGSTDFDNYPSIIQLTTGDFIVCGESEGPISGEKTVGPHTYNGFPFDDFWCVKLDSMGNKLWDKVYGGPQEDLAFSGFSMLTCSGGYFIIAGETQSDSGYEISSTYKGNLDIWIMKADSAGNKIWDRRYGGVKNNWITNIINTNDGGYILCGSTNSPQGGDVSEPSRGDVDAWVIKLDSFGNKQWDHRYGGNKGDGATKIEQVPGGYLVGANTRSDSSYEVTENSYGGAAGDYWVFKIDSMGNKLWDKRFGGPNGSVLRDFAIMPDSSIYLFGYAQAGISPTKTDSGKGFEDYWLVHFKYVDTTATGVGVNEYEKEGNFSVYPNPVHDKFKVSGSKFKVEEISVFDVMGNVLLINAGKQENEIDISSLAPGLYFVKVKTQRGVYTQKVVKE